ncbi:MAG: ACT domain-containing protein [Crenarchaeota archaeon]|nr:ACT domain-containing protein [Thermoproteota archaeon]
MTLLDPLLRCPEDLGFTTRDNLWLCSTGTQPPDPRKCLIIVKSMYNTYTCISPEKKGKCIGPLTAIIFEPLDPSVVGFIAAVSTALARLGISILAYSCYEHDYILIPQQHKQEAIQALEEIGCIHKKQ